ncbi:hypothetical protein B296_00021330 [Ensete ventricosum]|uniref:Uncharacterized protein n=1 Tax=Ensete ventricosum TaxID=4639 RepID=A0A427AEZ9_ENSVE|nr:hypothetical protein B296_00021330 [Ensete ventricosum]
MAGSTHHGWFPRLGVRLSCRASAAKQDTEPVPTVERRGSRTPTLVPQFAGPVWSWFSVLRIRPPGPIKLH